MEPYKEAFKRAGLDYDTLTKEQRDLILEPSEAPENFHHDGEVTPEQAMKIWLRKLTKSGLTPLQTFRATKLNFG